MPDVAKYSANEWSRRQYHNERIYWNLEFFSKITLAICGGLAYLSIYRPIGDPVLIGRIMNLGGFFQILVGWACLFNVFSHIRAKWRSEKNRPPFLKRIRHAADLYIMIVILTASILVSYVAFSGYLLARK